MLKKIIRNCFKPHILQFTLCIIALASLLSCGSQSSSTNYAGITFTLQWSDQGIDSRSPGIMRTVPANVINVRMSVSASDMTTMSQTFPASTGSGSITNVPPGSNRTISFDGLDANSAVIYQGAKTSVNLTAGQSYDCGTVTMHTVGTSYTVTYNGNGNTGGSVPIDSTNYQQGQTVTVLGNTGNLVKTNSFFAGWNTQATGSGTPYTQAQIFTMGAANVTLYAKWTANSTSTYTVTYNGNGNTGGSVPIDSNYYTNGQTVTVLGNTGSLARVGGSFAGWSTGTGTTYTQGQTFQMGSANVTLYAVWVAGTSAAPTGVNAAAGNAQNIISWSTVTGATSYNLYWSTTSVVTKATGTKISGVTSPYTHTGRTNGTTYYYVVTAVNAGGESVESSQMSATPQVSATPQTYSNVPDTGQTTCYDSSGAVIFCTGAGQDGSYTISAPSYTDNGNGTITDNVTGLVWQKQDDGTLRNWDAANTYCSSLAQAGTGWRLPNDFELVTIVDFGKTNPSINLTYFPSTQSDLYWSSSIDVHSNTVNAWYVDFSIGSLGNPNKTSTFYVRCVR